MKKKRKDKVLIVKSIIYIIIGVVLILLCISNFILNVLVNPTDALNYILLIIVLNVSQVFMTLGARSLGDFIKPKRKIKYFNDEEC